MPLRDTLSQFIKRYLEDQSLIGLLINGDYHPRHHVPGSGGAFFFTTFVLVLMGFAIVLARHWRDPWWRFILFGLLASIVPGAVSVEPFHGMRLIAYPVFLLVMTVPALEWLLARKGRLSEPIHSSASEGGAPGSEDPPLVETGVVSSGVPYGVRLGILCALLILTGVETYRFQTVFRRNGPNRYFDFDAGYKTVYDAAVKQPIRPIYLEDGMWGPGYIHAFWYATLEKRPTSQFIHLADGARPPAGAMVITSADKCEKCETLAQGGVYKFYKQL